MGTVEIIWDIEGVRIYVNGELLERIEYFEHSPSTYDRINDIVDTVSAVAKELGAKVIVLD